ncbi:MAG: universal stress protein [Candidatus Zixiibacteriota bacterium]|nr:MAG: universal stress protein [candidate division Zixibacteria bacterium]
MFTKILCADDLGEHSLEVLRTALDLARRYGAHLTVLNAREDFMNEEEMVMLRVDASNFQEDMRKKALAVQRHIHDDIASFQGQDVAVDILLREGKPEKVIIDVAREINADLIVIGTHGISGLKDRLFGATSQEVIQHAGRTILAVWNRK